jgi:hypothetical protein
VQDDREWGYPSFTIRAGQQVWNGINDTNFTAGKTYTTHLTISVGGTCAIGQTLQDPKNPNDPTKEIGNSPTGCAFWSLG